jgi:superfamily II DNA helicase RecQ
MLCALFPSVPVLALSATASKKDREAIKGTLHMRNPLEVALTDQIFSMKKYLGMVQILNHMSKY